MNRTLAAGAAVVLAFTGLVSGVLAQDKITICHAAGQADTTKFVTLELPPAAVFGPAGHFNEDGTPAAGHEQDYMGACEAPEASPVPSQPGEPTPTPDPKPTPTPDGSQAPRPTPYVGTVPGMTLPPTDTE